MICLPKICGPYSVKELTIKLDNDGWPHYRHGQQVTGFVFIEVDGKMPMDKVSLSLVGDVKVEWRSGRTAFFDKSRFYQMNNILKTDLTRVATGSYKMAFKLTLPQDGLLNSFEDNHGKIEYRLIARIKVPNWPDKKFKQVIYIHTNGMSKIITSNTRVAAQKPSMFWWGKPIKISCELNGYNYNPGSIIKVTVQVDNSSKYELDLRARLVRKVRYQTHNGARVNERIILARSFEVVMPKERGSKLLSLAIPGNVVPTTKADLIELIYLVDIDLIRPLGSKLKGRLFLNVAR